MVTGVRRPIVGPRADSRVLPETAMKRLDIAVPALVALMAVAIVWEIAPPDTVAYDLAVAPTPYSQDHARVMMRAGEPEEQPPTF
jgi:hypothetical protein